MFDRFFSEYETFMSQGFKLIKERYISRCSFIGKEILITNVDDKKFGLASQINDDGSLLLSIPNENKHEIVRIGDLTCLKTN